MFHHATAKWSSPGGWWLFRQWGPPEISQVYNPVSKTFRRFPPNSAKARAGHATTLLPNGKVLFTGGSGDTTAEMFDPISETFTPLSGQMQCVRKDHPSQLMPNGMVLLGTGGRRFFREIPGGLRSKP